MGSTAKKSKKNKIPVLKSDEDFLKAFEKQNGREKERSIHSRSTERNKENQGPDIGENNGFTTEDVFEEDVDFEKLLEESFKNKTKSRSTPKKSMPEKKRLKRYPPPECDLDLHGFTAIGAEVKTRSFITACKQQGYFTVRVIVGKGLHSDFGAVLPDVVEDVVKELKKQHMVLSWKWDGKKKSSAGALIVYLKQFEQFDL